MQIKNCKSIVKAAKNSTILAILLAFTLLASSSQSVYLNTVHAAPGTPPKTEWSQTYGGTSSDYAYCVVQTSDGGYALAGYTLSYGAGSDDFWLVKTDASGNKQWNKTYGGVGNDFAQCAIQTSDGGYALAGYTASYGAGSYDFWLVKTDSSGNKQWDKTYGGTSDDYAQCVVQTSDGGYAIAGYTSSYGAGLSDFWLVKTDASGNKLWSKTYGGTSDDVASCVVQTSDGGYAIAGYTSSYGAGNGDFWLVKTDASGNKQWDKTYGGTSGDYGWCVVQTSDGGYALAGYTLSYGAGGDDFWLVKTDASGNKQWDKTYGGTSIDVAWYVVQTSDRGYAIAGYTLSFGAGNYDFWLVKTDSLGSMLWSQTYGGTNTDWAYCVVQTSDGGYALAGYTNSYGAGNYDFWLVKLAGTISNTPATFSRTYGGTSNEGTFCVVQTSDGGYALAGYTGGGDFWLVKTDASGNKLWDKAYGGTKGDIAQWVIQTSDGGYALAGYTESYGAGSADFWLVKTDASGNKQWDKTYGGTNADVGYCVVQTSDGGYALTGDTNSYSAGFADFWLVKTDSSGNKLWDKTYGGTNNDIAYCIVQTSDGGYALTGYTESYGAGGYDFWLIKTDSSGNKLWDKTYGGTGLDVASRVVQTSDSGYAVAGDTPSYGAGSTDFWLVKTDSSGNKQWDKTYGGTGADDAFCVVQTSDGGYALAGTTGSYGAGSNGFWLVKTDSSGNKQWDKTYGGTTVDVANCVVQTSDGGYALAGYTYSYGAGGSDFWLVKTDSSGLLQSPCLVVRGADNKIYYRTCNSISNAWNNWNALPGSTIDSPAAAVINNELHVVVRGADGNSLWHSYVNLATNSFSGWTLLSGSTPSPPTLISDGNKLYLVVRGGDNRIYYRNYTLAVRSWGSWSVLASGTTQDTPAAAVLGNKLHVIVRGSSGDSIWHGYVDLSTAAFSGWTLLGGSTPSKPTLISRQMNSELHLVVRGSNNVIYRNVWRSGVWVGWQALPSGTTLEGPAATIANGALNIAVKGTDGTTLWSSRLDLTSNSFSGWTMLSGNTPSKPTLTS